MMQPLSYTINDQKRFWMNMRNYQMLKKTGSLLAQVKDGNNSYKLENEIRQIVSKQEELKQEEKLQETKSLIKLI